MTIRTRDFELHPWQQDAVDAWVQGYESHPFTGTLEIVTGGGKTLIALACAARVAEQAEDLHLAIVVPTEALARQWRQNLLLHTTLKPEEVGLLGAGGKATFTDRRAIVAVINTASTKLPPLAASGQPLMLIVDECHRAGAPKYREVLRTRAPFRLGLSATPDREELDESGEPLSYDEQAVGQSLGGVVYRFTLKDARRAGWLPEFSLHHHGIALAPDERREYDTISRRVDDAADSLRAHGVEPVRARSIAGRKDEAGDAARLWVQLTAQRKDLLYRAQERQRVAQLLTAQLFRDGSRPRVLLFHERVHEAEALFDLLSQTLPNIRVELEHSKLPDRRRTAALAAFASGAAPILVSVKSLIEGIDVPQADTGMSVASTSAVRQRVQALGRVLRRAITEAGESKVSTMHLLYVADTVDDLIYSKADWTDLTGAAANRYWRWKYEANEPDSVDTPPRTPRPTEEQAWDLLGRRIADDPVPWPGMPVGQEYTVKTNGSVHNAFGAQIANPQQVAQMVARVRGRRGGRFRVTPEFGLVLVWQPTSDQPTFFVVGQLKEPFCVVPEVDATTAAAERFEVGARYNGPGDKAGGTFKVSQRGGGLIERRVRGGAEIAQVAGTGQSEQEANAREILAAWENLQRSFSRFFVNSLGHAWYESSTGRQFLGLVEEGFAWPDRKGDDS
ncbi:DEAD/DEAH box helicase [Mycobacterium sp. OAE908]|uniref:DEAD/DEAH box helicase n=1 Tax=Mycobacterium sp. OAE908 TaxID=2817899 RepID=UPI001AE3E9C5